ncbi:hypothetical protein IscW_ISCW006708 [Ixodes scapularis]|uniref:Uncharacterized protein n=1 Tax=Ixodes scapularis TaxID=6945 RepID=B7PQV6_IXOSC|nr:hypothetical protein IscW_ISCW006708 [Ixodes scapularis]|eukprot:XP_002436148.1 hypothetical protein IscW_ISCW006708 [Ixodes scapularis]
MGGLFSGRIVTPDNEYYVERASRYFGNASAFHSIFYAAEDVAFPGNACGFYGAAKAWVEDIQYRYASYRQKVSLFSRILTPCGVINLRDG